ncbi:MAG TPA: DUF5335 family protein [Anaerolineae bacterium]|nr:DUF5335 family protein [Anaerolineae bacterium]
MPTVEIPKKEWKSFLDSFSQMHENWLVGIEVEGTGIDDDRQVLLDAGTFHGVSMSEDSDEDLVIVGAGSLPQKHVIHSVDGTERIVVERDERGADMALRIEASDGTNTIVSFERSVPPEMLNGV